MADDSTREERRFGAYEVVAELGHGGMADVLLAAKPGPGGFRRLVVIKRLREHLAGDPELVAMLLDEARLAARLDHPNIVKTYEAGKVGRHVYLAMEYLEGQPLARLIRKAAREGAPLPLDLQLLVFVDVLAALEHAHDRVDLDGAPLQVVHRDVSPSNVFVTYEGISKLVDFGIAKASGRSVETRAEVVKGKTTYMAPEQARGRAVDGRADVFAVGVMLWEACAGRRMWGEATDIAILGRLMKGQNPTSPRDENPTVDPELDAICRRALAPDASNRYQTALAFHDALSSFLERRSDPPSRRALGQRVSQLFAVDRGELKARIATRLADLGRGGSRGSDTATTRRSSRPARRSRAPLVAAGGAIAAASLAVVFWPPPPPTPDPAIARGIASAGAAAGAPSAEVSPATVRVHLNASPSTAKFSIDGGAWLDNPHQSERPRDDASHELRIRASGFEEKTMTIRLDRDVVLDVTLKRRARPFGAPRPPPPKPGAPPLPKEDPWSD